MRNALALEKLPMPSVRPWIVVRGEFGAVFDAGMVVEPELDQRIRIGIFEPGLAQLIECGDRGFFGIGHDAVNRLLPIDIGLMLKMPADGAGRRLREEAGNGNGEEQYHEACARRQIHGPPSCSIAPYHPCSKTRAR